MWCSPCVLTLWLGGHFSVLAPSWSWSSPLACPCPAWPSCVTCRPDHLASCLKPWTLICFRLLLLARSGPRRYPQNLPHTPGTSDLLPCWLRRSQAACTKDRGPLPGGHQCPWPFRPALHRRRRQVLPPFVLLPPASRAIQRWRSVLSPIAGAPRSSSCGPLPVLKPAGEATTRAVREN